MKGNVLSVEKVMAAEPTTIFDVLADVGRHHLIDGSGMLQGPGADDPARLAPGTTFGMRMKLLVRYSTVNRVVEFAEGRRIAWKTGPEGFAGRLLAGRVWRYQLEPVEGGTLVRESWDITEDHQRFLLKLGGIYSRKTRRDMERTLNRLDALVASSPSPTQAT